MVDGACTCVAGEMAVLCRWWTIWDMFGQRSTALTEIKHVLLVEAQHQRLHSAFGWVYGALLNTSSLLMGFPH